MQPVIRVSSPLKQDVVFSWQVFIFCMPFIPFFFFRVCYLQYSYP
jgi:outer membrane lipoprotein LolB